jgi:hypothetical protein
MARVEAALYSILSGTAAVTAQVSTRIYPSFLPQDTALPALTYFRVSTIREEAMNTDPGRATARFQVSVWTTSAYSAGTIADIVRSALHRNIGTYGGVTITDLAIENEVATYDFDTEEHQVAMDFLIQHVETT